GGPPLIQHGLIESGYETETARHFSILGPVEAAILQEPPAASQFIAPGFQSPSIFVPVTGHRKGRKLGSRDTGCRGNSLVGYIEMIDLLVNHLPDAVRHTKLNVFDFDNQFPTLSLCGNQALRDEVIDSVYHKQRISTCSCVNQVSKLGWKSIARKPDAEIA